MSHRHQCTMRFRIYGQLILVPFSSNVSWRQDNVTVLAPHTSGVLLSPSLARSHFIAGEGVESGIHKPAVTSPDSKKVFVLEH